MFPLYFIYVKLYIIKFVLKGNNYKWNKIENYIIIVRYNITIILTCYLFNDLCPSSFRYYSPLPHIYMYIRIL